jgi:hypothetical protein
MTQLLEEAISQLRELPPADQDEAAEVIMSIVEARRSEIRLSPDQLESLRKTMEGLKDGTVGIATDDEVAAMWRRLGA